MSVDAKTSLSLTSATKEQLIYMQPKPGWDVSTIKQGTKADLVQTQVINLQTNGW